jgi:hypothetical protein
VRPRGRAPRARFMIGQTPPVAAPGRQDHEGQDRESVDPERQEHRTAARFAGRFGDGAHVLVAHGSRDEPYGRLARRERMPFPPGAVPAVPPHLAGMPPGRAVYRSATRRHSARCGREVIGISGRSRYGERRAVVARLTVRLPTGIVVRSPRRGRASTPAWCLAGGKGTPGEDLPGEAFGVLWIAAPDHRGPACARRGPCAPSSVGHVLRGGVVELTWSTGGSAKCTQEASTEQARSGRLPEVDDVVERDEPVLSALI